MSSRVSSSAANQTAAPRRETRWNKCFILSSLSSSHPPPIPNSQLMQIKRPRWRESSSRGGRSKTRRNVMMKIVCVRERETDKGEVRVVAVVVAAGV